MLWDEVPSELRAAHPEQRPSSDYFHDSQMLTYRNQGCLGATRVYFPGIGNRYVKCCASTVLQAPYCGVHHPRRTRTNVEIRVLNAVMRHLWLGQEWKNRTPRLADEDIIREGRRLIAEGVSVRNLGATGIAWLKSQDVLPTAGTRTWRWLGDAWLDRQEAAVG